MKCIERALDISSDPYALTWLRSCDTWIVPHFIAPFLITIMTRDVLFGAFSAFLGEAIELFSLAVIGNFAIYPGANNDLETYGGILEDILQGVIGAVVGYLYIWVFSNSPRMVRLRDFFVYRGQQRNLKRGVVNLIFMLLLVAPATLYQVKTEGDFAVGILVYAIIQTALVLLMAWPFFKWPGRTEFWATFIIFSLVLNVQNMWDYLYSRAIQSWVIIFAFCLYLFVRSRFTRAKRSRYLKDPDPVFFFY